MTAVPTPLRTFSAPTIAQGSGHRGLTVPLMAWLWLLLLATGPLGRGITPAWSSPSSYAEQGFDRVIVVGNQTLLLSYYQQYGRDRDAERFGDRVAARYDEQALRFLLFAQDVQVRRAAVFALGEVGRFETANATLALALKDDDAKVRRLATQALWSVWFRADSPENNARLEQIDALNSQREYREAEQLATQLIDRAPDFAEAYNQRAIARFRLHHYADSAADCLRTLDLNPYHIGALSGLGQCYLRLDRPRAALRVFQRALKLQPHNQGLKQTVQALGAAGF